LEISLSFFLDTEVDGVGCFSPAIEFKEKSTFFVPDYAILCAAAFGTKKYGGPNSYGSRTTAWRAKVSGIHAKAGSAYLEADLSEPSFSCFGRGLMALPIKAHRGLAPPNRQSGAIPD
jgi:hypothetical protein